MSKNNLMDKIVSLSKRRGFIFQSSEIYGGLANSWDYGPLGVELKNNLKKVWWAKNVHWRDDMVGQDSAIFMHTDTWKASGHLDTFNDIMVDCKECKGRFREDHIDTKCPSCGANNFTKGRPFNLMLDAYLGPVRDESGRTYLRPETAQGIFVNFKNILDSTSRKLPFGVAQIGKSFRNEITAGNFIFRQREFEQMEIEYFCHPDQADVLFEQWIADRFAWYKDLGICEENLRLRPHDADELAHYAKGCTDIEYNFPFGWSELEGIAHRSDFDLKQHSEHSGKDLSYRDPFTNEKFIPYVIEPSGGVDRAMLAFLVDAYCEEEVEGRTRVILKLHKDLVPTKVAVLPLLKKNDRIVSLAKSIKNDLIKDMTVVYNDTAAIGKLYRRQDEVGTLYCVTVDVESLEDKKVTVRDRDTMCQERISVDSLRKYLRDKVDN